MTTKKIYGPWIKWGGGKYPVPPSTLAEVKCRSGRVLAPRLAYRYSWKHIGSNGDIVGYRTARFFSAEFDPLLFKRRMAYLEKEHALIAARHIFGLKGGEL